MNKSNLHETARQRPSSWVEGVSGLVKRLCVSVSNCLIYSPSHPTAQQTIRQTSDWLIDLLQRKNLPITISVANHRILFEGLPLEERNLLVHQLAKFLEEVHSDDLTFHRGLTLDDVTRFHIVIAQGADAIKKQGGLAAILKKNRINCIRAQESRLVMITKKQRVVSADAKVTSGGTGVASAEQHMVNYLAEAVLKETRDRKWLFREIGENRLGNGNLLYHDAGGRPGCGSAEGWSGHDSTFFEVVHSVPGRLEAVQGRTLSPGRPGALR